MRHSVVVPIYKNESSLDRLLNNLDSLKTEIKESLEVIFVVDGSPDKCYEILSNKIKNFDYKAKLVLHSKNFGSFAAIKTGLKFTEAEFSAVYSADSQEPIELIQDFFHVLENGSTDVVVGSRKSRSDGLFNKFFSNIFWRIYRKLVDKNIPKGGIDVFACNKEFRHELLKLQESRSSLVALIYWMGFRREVIEYDRQPRKEGRSAWSFRKKIDYLLDSLFSFTDLPIKALLVSGFVGLIFSLALSIGVLAARLAGNIEIPGYSPTILIILFFGALNTFGLGLVGSYAWRAYENTKQRPHAIVAKVISN